MNGSASTDTVVINKATTTTAGVMSAADKTKLDAALTASDSIATAARLATARTIWGQAFDGSANVRGNISDVDDVYMNNNRSLYIKDTNGKNISTLSINDQNGFYLGFGASSNGYSSCLDGNIILFRTATSHTERMRITSDGKVGIGTSAPDSDLHVSGNGYNLKLNCTTDSTKDSTFIWGSSSNKNTAWRIVDNPTSGLWLQYGVSGADTHNMTISGMNATNLNALEVKAKNLTVNGSKVWHAGNDGTGSGLDADLLDGHHAGFENSNIALYANFPNWSTLITDGLLREDYATAGHPTVDFLQAICKWTIRNYKDKSGITIQGRISPNSQGWCVISLYSNNGFDETTLLPKYCSAQYNALNGESYLFGTYNAVWYCNQIVTNNNLEDTLAYWYENNETASSTTCLTGGNRNVIESLRSKFKRCIAKPYGDDAALISYCNEENSANWPDGSAIDIDLSRKENRMVYFPKYYHKTVERSPGIWRTYISEQQIDGDYIEEPEMLLSTFEAYTNTDGTLMSVWGVASTASQTMATFISQAKSNGPLWSIGDYRSHATIARMFCAYYKTTNISTSNSAIPCSGGTKRYNYGVTGATITLGNRDGKKATTNDTSYYSTNFLGLEDCYYSKWEFVQGINILKGKYVVYDGGSFPDKDVAELEAAGATNIRVVGYEPNPAATEAYNGWIKAVAQGKYGDVVPTAHGGSETTYYSDYSWFNPTGNRIFLRSGNSDIGSRCGVFVANASNASSASWTTIGARLAFYGKIVVVDSDTFKKMQA